MTDEVWRPLGVEAEDQIAEYDALHDGVPPWMSAAYWAWVRRQLVLVRADKYGERIAMLNVQLAEEMCQRLQILLPNLQSVWVDAGVGEDQLNKAIGILSKHPRPLQIADYLLAYGNQRDAKVLNDLLGRSKSSMEVGMRLGRPGLVRRVPLGVQVAADGIMARAGQAGVRLAKAWEELYGILPDASAAYALAIKAVEDAAIPVVSPKNGSATLGTVLKQVEDQGNWQLPMEREHDRAPSRDVLVGMMRMLWHGQHDRHGGQPSSPGNVSIEEATVAVSIAVTLVNLFDAGLVKRDTAEKG